MNQQIKERWMSALVSGEYKQGKGFLHQQHKFCCLGVLCDLYLKETEKSWVYDDSDGSYSIDEEFGTLPDEVMKWAELTDRNPSIRGIADLATLNDIGHTFENIAQHIQESL